MITITEQKPLEEILQSLGESKSLYIIGCGACATMLHTGGKSEVLAMKEKLEEAGKKVTGWMVIPTVCDQLTDRRCHPGDVLCLRGSDCRVLCGFTGISGT